MAKKDPTTFAYGGLEENGDTWLLMAGPRIIPLDLPNLDPSFMSLEHKTVSVIGKMGIPHDAPGIVKLMVDKLVSHADIAKRAYAIDESGRGGSADENWFQAERELLGIANG